MNPKLHNLKLSENPSGEPAIKVGGIITAIIGLFGGLNLVLPDLMSDTTESAILSAAAFVLPIITAVIARGFVWSPKSVLEVVDAATDEALKVANTPLPQREKKDPFAPPNL